MFNKRKNPKYCATCPGYVVKVRCQGNEEGWRATVNYTVNGVEYTLKEMLRVRKETIKAGPVPIGQRTVPILNIQEGSTVTVCYRPDKPDKAYIVGNDGTLMA